MSKPVDGERRDFRLDLGCGQFPMRGFEGVDVVDLPSVSYVVDLRKAPWPWPDDSVLDVFSSHFLEHLTGAERLPFMDELWRVMKPGGGQAVFVVPHARSARSWQDPTHQWPPLSEESFAYWTRAFREEHGLTHYPINQRTNFRLEWEHTHDRHGFVEDLVMRLLKEE